MESERKMTKKKMRFTDTNKEGEGGDRISSLPDELIHHVLWFSDVQTAVQTSILSKRWKLVWTTLPFLNFTRYDQQRGEYIRCRNFDSFRHVFFNSSATEIKLFDKFFSHRNHVSDILKLYLSFFFAPPPNMVHKFIDYAISHRVQELNVHIPDLAIKLSTFNSTSIKKLALGIDFHKLLDFSDCWDLPALTTLQLICPSFVNEIITFPELYLICLPCLQTLFLDGVELPNSLSLPALTTLYLARCKLPFEVWDLSALSTLTLDNIVDFPKNVTEFFLALVNLRNLTWFFRKKIIMTDCVINCPQLVNLHIYACMSTFSNHSGKFMVLAPKIRNFSSVGVFPITFGLSLLEYVDIKLRDSTGEIKTLLPSKLKHNRYYRRLAYMFQVLGSAKILTLDLETIQALSAVSDFLVSSPPPFYNLKYVKVPQGYEESRMSTDLKFYLLGRSPKATIVTTLPQKHIIPHTEATSVTARNVVLQEPLTSPINMLVDSENPHKTVCVNTLDKGVEDNVVQNPIVSADGVTQIGVPVKRTGSDSVSSSRGDSDLGVWQGHEVKSEFVSLLDRIMIKYPETFENFTTKNKKVCTTKLNMLCTSVNDFTKFSLTDVNTEMIALYRDVFSCLEKFGFNVSWLVSRLKHIEKLRFPQSLLSELRTIDCHIEDAKSKLDLQVHNGKAETILQDLQTLLAEKVQEIQTALGTMRTNLVLGYVGDDLLCDP